MVLTASSGVSSSPFDASPNTSLTKIRPMADLRRLWEHNPPNEPDPRITGTRFPAMEEVPRMDSKIKHLELIQGVINRLASDSFRMKGWSVVLVAALFILLAREGRTEFLAVAWVPVVFFWGLDGYFLWQERLFRALYDHD